MDIGGIKRRSCPRRRVYIFPVHGRGSHQHSGFTLLFVGHPGVKGVDILFATVDGRGSRVLDIVVLNVPTRTGSKTSTSRSPLGVSGLGVRSDGYIGLDGGLATTGRVWST